MQAYPSWQEWTLGFQLSYREMLFTSRVRSFVFSKHFFRRFFFIKRYDIITFLKMSVIDKHFQVKAVLNGSWLEVNGSNQILCFLKDL